MRTSYLVVAAAVLGLFSNSLSACYAAEQSVDSQADSIEPGQIGEPAGLWQDDAQQESLSYGLESIPTEVEFAEGDFEADESESEASSSLVPEPGGIAVALMGLASYCAIAMRRRLG